MKKTPALTRTLLSLAISALGMPMAAHAALSFSTAPAGSATKEPAPNGSSSFRVEFDSENPS